MIGRPDVRRIRRGMLLAASGAAVLLVLSGILWPGDFYRSYLYAYVFWLGAALGCLALFMLHQLVSGGWGHVVQRVSEAGMRTIPLWALLFLPILLGMHRLYPWMEALKGDTGGGIRTAYLALTPFVLRALLYFIVWSVGALLLSAWSARQDHSGDPVLTRRMRLLSAPGLIVYVLTMTFASVDWLMSLEPGWSSTVYGFLIVVSQVLTALAVVIIALRFLGEAPPLSHAVTVRHVHHLGNLLLTFVILWAYMAYSQFIVIWAGNLPEETTWYLHRLAPGWSSLGLFVVIAHFFLPFALLLFRTLKRSIRTLAWIAGWVLLMRVIESYWLVVPAFHPAGITAAVTDLLAPVALGVIWIAAFTWQLGERPLLPLHDPRFAMPVEVAGG